MSRSLQFGDACSDVSNAVKRLDFKSGRKEEAQRSSRLGIDATAVSSRQLGTALVFVRSAADHNVCSPFEKIKKR